MPLDITRNRSSNIRSSRNYNAASLQNEINRLFNSVFSDVQMPSPLYAVNQNALPSSLPAIDIIESENSFKVEAELPGIDQDDIEVTINDHCLIIRGEKKLSDEKQGENFISQERYYGEYQRAVVLPEYADTDKANASFKHGVLWVEIPKKPGAETKSRRLEIKNA
jgi:HSP20 family protein